MIIKAAKRIYNSDKICRSYSDLNFGVTFFGTQCIWMYMSLSDWIRFKHPLAIYQLTCAYSNVVNHMER